ncbi:MAG: hypothetical protein ACFBSD_13325 [Paracoccaceae bacterium]
MSTSRLGSHAVLFGFHLWISLVVAAPIGALVVSVVLPDTLPTSIAVIALTAGGFGGILIYWDSFKRLRGRDAPETAVIAAAPAAAPLAEDDREARFAREVAEALRTARWRVAAVEGASGDTPRLVAEGPATVSAMPVFPRCSAAPVSEAERDTYAGWTRILETDYALVITRAAVPPSTAGDDPSLIVMRMGELDFLMREIVRRREQAPLAVEAAQTGAGLVQGEPLRRAANDR